MQLIRRMATGGLAVMAMVATAAAIWPGVASLVSGLLITVLSIGTAVLCGLAARWARGELAWRRELRTTPPLDVPTYDTAHGAPGAPTLAGLRDSA